MPPSLRGRGTVDPPASGSVRGLLLVALAALLWALIGVCARELGDLGVDGGEVGTWRALVGGACFALHWLWRSRDPGTRPPGGAESVRGRTGSLPHGRRLALATALFCAIGVVVFYASLPMAVQTGGISLAWVLLYTAPVWVTLGAALVLGEEPDRAQLGAVLASVAGVVALVSSVGGTVEVTLASVAWGLVAGLSYSSYYLLGRRLFERMGAVTTYAAVLPVGGLVLALLTGLTVPDSAEMVAWLLLLGVGCTYVPYLLFGLAIPTVDSGRAVVVATVEPVAATAIGVAFYGETLGLLGAAGAAVVLAAAVVSGTRR